MSAAASPLPRCTDCIPGERALLETLHGPVVAEVVLRPLTHPRTGDPLELRERTPMHEHALFLGFGDGELRWRGEVVEPFALDLPTLRNPLTPAGAPFELSPHNVLGWFEHITPIAQILAPIHRLAAETLVDPLELHAERLHHAHQRLQRYRNASGTHPYGTFTFVAPRAILESELAYLHLSATRPDEHELRRTSLALAPEWAGSARELLDAARRLLS